MKNSANSHGWVNPRDIEDIWKVCNPLPPFCSAYAHSPRFLQDHFDYYYREFDEFIFPMTIHPQVSGKPQVILMHESIIEYINSHEGVEWVTMEQMVDEFKSGKIPGAVVEGGV